MGFGDIDEIGVMRWFCSKAKKEAKVDVSYTERKYLRPPPQRVMRLPPPPSSSPRPPYRPPQ